ncbi:MAG: RagB/SusD family nutrient uptake outer membrane protein, partial [Bacteroidetes bacterium]|nr:RagB/SusD family nutrient uptake outer membrane protein [Bacteroidota bacterium]
GVLVSLTGCKKYLNIPLPSDSISGADAFASDGTASGVLDGVYYFLQVSGRLAGSQGLGYYAGLYSDELQAVNSANAVTKSFYSNMISGNSGGGDQWSALYSEMVIANTVIENMRGSSLPHRDQWLGEALFLRGLMYSYLVNLYGDVPLALTSDYQKNNALARTAKSEVYKQVIADLKEAQGLVSAGYVNYSGAVVSDRSRPNKAAVAALLARVYLYTGDWVNAEAQASMVIGNSLYSLDSLTNVFLVSGKEIIWGLLPTTGLQYRVADAQTYLVTPGTIPTASGVSVVLSPQLVGSFEPGDARFTNWVGVSTSGGTNYYFASKYKVKSGAGSNVEMLSILRLAEMYLIRAEARAMQNNPGGAASDINAVRARAHLAATTAASQSDLLAAVMQERKVEFFTEQGHRFFDLKRTGTVDAIMAAVAPQKSTSWASYMQYWPIPLTETQRNPNLTQTPGYQQ